MDRWTWILCLAYPQCVDTETKNLLDVAEELLPMNACTTPELSRWSRLTQWLETIRDQGLLTRSEHANVRTALAPNI